MRLLKKAGIGKVRHHVADGSRAQPFTTGARKRARADRLSTGYKCLDYGGQNFPFAPAGWS
jgi:hypothetical protein